MNSFRHLAVFALAVWIFPSAGRSDGAGYVGSTACRSCHPAQFQSQLDTAHAHALRRAQPTDPGPGRHAQWAFGAAVKARTWVTQTGEESIVEHGLSYYSVTKSLGLTPGHATNADLLYRTFDPVESALRCFRCHSTGPVTLNGDFQIQPSEPGVHCESCHGPGRAHAESIGRQPIQNPRKLTAIQISTLCGACHRQATDLDDDTDWTNVWNVRHQPRFLHRAACFRNSSGALSCLTCHDAHRPLNQVASSYDAKCSSCHAKVTHTSPIASRGCVGCHMPQVATTPNLKFTNHWIGIYDPRGNKLMPSKRMVQDLQPIPGRVEAGNGFIIPADVSTLVSVYEKAVALKENQSGPGSRSVAQAAFDLGRFLLQINHNDEAQAALQRTLSIDEGLSAPEIDADRESLAIALDMQGKHSAAFTLFRQAAEGSSPEVSVRSFVKLAEKDKEHVDQYYRKAMAVEEKSSGGTSPRIAMLLHQYALTLRARNLEQQAEPVLRRALAIQRSLPKADAQVTVGILVALGNLLEGRGQLDEAEKLEHSALALAERKLGPESPQLAITCTNLADVFWNKKNWREAGLLYRRAITIDTALYGPDRPETAADIANLGMLMKDAGQPAAGLALLQQALAVYEKTLGSDSDEARFIKEKLTNTDR